MRLLMMSPTLGGGFGQERVAATSSRLLVEQGHDTFHIVDSWVGEEALPPNVCLVEGLSSLFLLSDIRKVTQKHAQVTRAIEAFRPDLVHLIDQFDFRLIRSIARKFPVVITAHTVAPSCPASTRHILPIGICEKKSGWGCIKNNGHYHCLDFLRNDLHRANTILNFLLRRNVLRRHATLLAISRYVEKVLIEDGFSSRQVKLVYNPVAVRPRPQPVTGATQPLLVVASRLVPLKGIEYLFHALKKIESTPWELWICGDGPLKASLEKLRAQLGLDGRIKFLGAKPYEEAARIMASSLCVIQPNVGPEGFGLSVAEASGMGIPVVGFNLPALNEIIFSGQNGLLVEPFNTEQLAQATQRVLSDSTFQSRCAELGPAIIRERFSEQAHLSATIAAYQACLNKPNSQFVPIRNEAKNF